MYIEKSPFPYCVVWNIKETDNFAKVHKTMLDWCRANVTDEWYQGGGFFAFKSKTDATLFKLIFG